MPNLKSKIINLKSDSGFTLIELMTVVAIMVILATVMVLNLAGQRAARDVKIAQNQLVSNIRLAQSYTLSARTLPSGQSVQFYVLKFDLAIPTQYTIQAIYNVSSSPQLADVQSINLPPNIKIFSIVPSGFPIIIDRSLAQDAPYTQTIDQTSCGLIAFSAPFGKAIFNKGCTQTEPKWQATDISYDDYEKIVNFVGNATCTNNGTPLQCSASSDSIMTITLSDVGKTVSKTVTINSITGAVIAN